MIKDEVTRFMALAPLMLPKLIKKHDSRRNGHHRRFRHIVFHIGGGIANQPRDGYA